MTPNTDSSMLPGTITAKTEQATGTPIALAYLENPFDDAFYQERSPITQVAKIKVPVFVGDGWRDGFEAGDMRMFQALERRQGVPTYLQLNPCTHKGCGGGFAPTDNPPGVDDWEALEIEFDQRYLMGMNVPEMPRVRLYDQVANDYIDTTAWPPPQSSFKREYLGHGTLSIDGLGVGTITPSRPASTTARYATNPAAGFSMSLDEQGTIAVSPYLPTDQRLEKNQGLTWRTPALTQPLTLAGPIALHLVAASSATNTDWFAKISDVTPSGAENIVSEGQLRASLRALARDSTPERAARNPDHAPAARARPLLRLRDRDRADRVHVRHGRPAADPADVRRPPQRCAGNVVPRPRPPGTPGVHPPVASGQHGALRGPRRYLAAAARLRLRHGHRRSPLH